MTKHLPLPVSHCATLPLPLPPRAADFSLEGGFGESCLLWHCWPGVPLSLWLEKSWCCCWGFFILLTLGMGLPLSFWRVFAPCPFSTDLQLCVTSAFAVWAVSAVCHRLFSVFFLTLRNCSALPGLDPCTFTVLVFPMSPCALSLQSDWRWSITVGSETWNGAQTDHWS